MLQPSGERVRLDPISRPLDRIHVTTTKGLRLFSSSDGSIEMQVGGAGVFGWIAYFVLLVVISVFGLAQRATAFEIVGWNVVASLLLLALLAFGDDGVYLTRGWRFGPTRVSRVMRLPLPVRIWPRDFVDVDEFEIEHQLWTKGIFSRRLHGGHQDTLRFGTKGSSRQVTVMVQGRQYSSATLRGANFSQHHAAEIEREIIPDLLIVAALAAAKVGVPLYVTETTFYVGSDSDG